jgi:hypothetical protein
MTSRPEARLLTNQHVPEDTAQIIAEAFSKSRIDLETRKTDSPEFYAFPEIIIPAAMILWVVGPYIKKVAEKMAEDHYDFAKDLWKRLFSKKPDVEYKLVRASGTESASPFSHNFSTTFEVDDALKISLLFRKDTSEADLISAIRQSFSYLIDVLDDDQKLARLRELCKSMIGFTGTAYMFRHTDGELYLLDWVESGRTGSLVTYEMAPI